VKKKERNQLKYYQFHSKIRLSKASKKKMKNEQKKENKKKPPAKHGKNSPSPPPFYQRRRRKKMRVLREERRKQVTKSHPKHIGLKHVNREKTQASPLHSFFTKK